MYIFSIIMAIILGILVAIFYFYDKRYASRNIVVNKKPFAVRHESLFCLLSPKYTSEPFFIAGELNPNLVTKIEIEWEKWDKDVFWLNGRKMTGMIAKELLAPYNSRYQAFLYGKPKFTVGSHHYIYDHQCEVWYVVSDTVNINEYLMTPL